MRSPRGTVVAVPKLRTERGTEGYGFLPYGHPKRPRHETSRPMKYCATCGTADGFHATLRHAFVPHSPSHGPDPVCGDKFDNVTNYDDVGLLGGEVRVDPALSIIGIGGPPAPTATDWDRRFLDLAHHVAAWSKDPSTQVGAVIVDVKRRVLAVGYNGFPRGVEDDRAVLGDRDRKLNLMVHAEMNAILNSGAFSRLEGSTLYSTLYPCNECAKAIVQAGVYRVVTYRPDTPRWKESHQVANEIFAQARVAVTIR